MATTRSRPPRGREQARHASGGAAAEHAGKIYGVAIGGVVIILAFLTFTSIGHVVDAAVQHFMLFYAGVFALIALCASVGLGFVATDRMILGPGHRIFVQSAHRAASFGALSFLVVHIVTEILAQRVHILDAFIPFLSPFRTFYIGLGTIASDLIILLVITSILRKRFTTNGKAWQWRAIHYSSYASFVFGVWHGLLGGRPGKPYVDWSYGLMIAFVAVGLAVRVLANSMRPKENLSSPAVAEATGSGSAPMRAASMFAQLGVARAAASGRLNGPIMVDGGRTAALGVGRSTGMMPAVAALSAPVMAEVVDSRAPSAQEQAEPVYEPGYEGPPRYRGAPRSQATGPMPRAASGPMPRATGPMPRATSGPMPRAASGPMPRAASGPIPHGGTGPIPHGGTGPMPRPASGPTPRAAASGPMPRAASGPRPRPATGPFPPSASGPMPRATGPMPGAASGPMPRAASGPRPQAASGPRPRPATGPMPRGGSGPLPPAGPARRPPAGPRPRAAEDEGAGMDRSVWNGGAMYPAAGGSAAPPWDMGLPEEDLGLRYRQPGPGMPGYRGGRPQGDDPYAGDPYSTGPYATDHHAPRPQGGDPYGWDGYR